MIALGLNILLFAAVVRVSIADSEQEDLLEDLSNKELEDPKLPPEKGSWLEEVENDEASSK